MKPKSFIFTVYLTGFLITAPACTDEMEPDNFQLSQKYSLSTKDFLFYADDEKYRQTDALFSARFSMPNKLRCKGF